MTCKATYLPLVIFMDGNHCTLNKYALLCRILPNPNSPSSLRTIFFNVFDILLLGFPVVETHQSIHFFFKKDKICILRVRSKKKHYHVCAHGIVCASKKQCHTTAATNNRAMRWNCAPRVASNVSEVEDFDLPQPRCGRDFGAARIIHEHGYKMIFYACYIGDARL